MLRSANERAAAAQRRSTYLEARKRYSDSLVTGLGMCITDLDLHVKLDRFMACSWPSSLLLDGAVFSQDSLRVDAQLVSRDEEGEEGDEENEDCVDDWRPPTTSLQPKRVDGSIERIEVYLRGGSMP